MTFLHKDLHIEIGKLDTGYGDLDIIWFTSLSADKTLLAVEDVARGLHYLTGHANLLHKFLKVMREDLF